MKPDIIVLLAILGLLLLAAGVAVWKFEEMRP